MVEGQSEGIERRGEIGKLAIEVFLALGVFGELIDRRQIHLPELLDLRARLGKRSLPLEHAGLGGQAGEHARQVGARLGKLLRQRRASHVGLLRRQPCHIHRLARGMHPLLGREALLIERAQRALGGL